MAKGPSTVYLARFLDWVTELMIDDDLYALAMSKTDPGRFEARKRICMQFRGKLGWGPPFISWDPHRDPPGLTLTKLREVPAKSTTPDPPPQPDTRNGDVQQELW